MTIIVDYSQTAISNLMGELGGRKDIEINVSLVRHMIINSIRGYKQKFGKVYGDIVIACDSKTYWRKSTFPYYKVHRKRDRDNSGFDWKAIFETLSLVREELHQFFPYKVLNVEGAEADDIIAVLAEWSQRNDLEYSLFDEEPKPFMIISGDHDFIQLQKYPNVKQYSSIKKKLVTPESPPHEYVIEHIIRGDKGDGVPNVLSDDDSIFNNVRQKPISSKKLAEWIKNPASMPQDATFKRNYDRNKSLVDLSQIPENIKADIINTFVSQPIKDRSNLIEYFMKNKMKQMLEVVQEF
jgi:hypothetical protein